RSTVSQQEAHRRIWRSATAAPPALREKSNSPVLHPDIEAALRSYRRGVIRRFGLGGVLATATSLILYLKYPEVVDTRQGLELSIGLVVSLLLWPVAMFVTKARCPRCKLPWLSAKYTEKKHGRY